MTKNDYKSELEILTKAANEILKKDESRLKTLATQSINKLDDVAKNKAEVKLNGCYIMGKGIINDEKCIAPYIDFSYEDVSDVDYSVWMKPFMDEVKKLAKMIEQKLPKGMTLDVNIREDNASIDILIDMTMIRKYANSKS